MRETRTMPQISVPETRLPWVPAFLGRARPPQRRKAPHTGAPSAP